MSDRKVTAITGGIFFGLGALLYFLFDEEVGWTYIPLFALLGAIGMVIGIILLLGALIALFSNIGD